MDEFKWVVQNKRNAYLFLAKKPYRYAANPTYKILIVWGTNGEFKIVSKWSAAKFRKNFNFIGRLK